MFISLQAGQNFPPAGQISLQCGMVSRMYFFIFFQITKFPSKELPLLPVFSTPEFTHLLLNTLMYYFFEVPRVTAYVLFSDDNSIKRYNLNHGLLSSEDSNVHYHMSTSKYINVLSEGNSMCYLLKIAVLSCLVNPIPVLAALLSEDIDAFHHFYTSNLKVICYLLKIAKYITVFTPISTQGT